MPIFLWEATTKSGESRRGEMEAENTEEVAKRLKAQNFYGLKIRKSDNLLKPLTQNFSLQTLWGSGVSNRELIVFTRQFSTMIDAGLPLAKCLEILAKEEANKVFKQIILDIKNRVEAGKTLAESLAAYPKVFNRLFVNLVAAGEAAGVLAIVLNRLTGYLEKNAKLYKRVRGALAYPLITVILSFLVTLVLLIYVIPSFASMFAGAGMELPMLTQWVMQLSNLASHNLLGLVIVLGGAVLAGKIFLGTPLGKQLLDTVLINIPIFGPLLKKVAVAKFSRTMGTLLGSGVNIMEALEIAAGAAGNIIVEEGLKVVRVKTSEGKPLAQSLVEVKIFPSMVIQMISVGESSGALDVMLTKIADFYDEEVDNAVGVVMGLLEPMVMVILAVILGGMVIAMYLPIFGMANVVGAA